MASPPTILTITSTLDEGVSTWVPYGISVDMTHWIEELRVQCEKLVADFKANAARTTDSSATPRPQAAGPEPEPEK